jgi:hypothetical protein
MIPKSDTSPMLCRECQCYCEFHVNLIFGSEVWIRFICQKCKAVYAKSVEYDTINYVGRMRDDGSINIDEFFNDDGSVKMTGFREY